MKLIIDIPDTAYEAYKEWHKNKVATAEQSLIAQGTPLPEGEWKHISGDEWYCSECGHVITTEGSWEHPLSIGAFHCENCGADMRKGGAEE